ncbi:hypothetical protein ACIGB8_29435 [Promicromonospora sukumoe]|uniref:hypothetical protein n=1 Tax=Promicromonospora sukumoe TaxID=88382 RepID=UPI0037CA0FC3
MNVDLEALASADSPSATALVWINRVVESDDSQSWYELSMTLRRWFVQRWISSAPDTLNEPVAESLTRDELVDFLVGPVGDDNALFPHMWSMTRRFVFEALGALLGEELAAESRPRTVAPGIEAVPILRAADLLGDGSLHHSRLGAAGRPLVLLLSHEQEMWFIASVGPWLPVLGWPPQVQKLPAPAID